MKREKAIPEIKLKRVKELAELIKNNKTLVIVSIKGIPGNQFQNIKKKLRAKAKVKVLKKNLILKGLEAAGLKKLEKYIHEDIALLFSSSDAFELAAMLAENQTSVKAKAGQEAIEDIIIEAGATDLPPGPAISELSAVGLKVKIEEGKIAIQERKVIVKKGGKINENVASMLAKLNITPFKVGFIPEIAYDSEEKKIYENIKIDKEENLKGLKQAAMRAFNLAINISYACKETIGFLLRKANSEEKVLEKFIQTQQNNQEETSQK